MKHPKINYPCEWEYKLIGLNEEDIRSAAAEALKTKQYVLSFSNISKAGKYMSFSLKTVVLSEEERNCIYASLRGHQAIKSIL